MRCFQTLDSCLFIHRCIYTWYIWHLSYLTSAPNVCLNILAMIHLACTFIWFGAMGLMRLKVDSQLKHLRNRAEIVIPIFLFVTSFFSLTFMSTHLGINSKIWEIQMIFHIGTIRANVSCPNRKKSWNFPPREPQGNVRESGPQSTN